MLRSARKIAVRGMYKVLRSKFVLNSFPFRNPPILLLSFPRSGSSWIGKVLSTSNSVVYLREPITQPYLQERGGTYALVNVNEDLEALSVYKDLSNEAFAGSPSKFPDVINGLRDFLNFQRNKKHILIKEVNPKAINFYHRRYDPQIILLIRHPAAVALSFARQKWLGLPDSQQNTNNPKADIWEKFGAAYGVIMKHAIETVNRCTRCAVIKYEDLAWAPEKEFKKLFEILELEVPDNYNEIIQRYCYFGGRVKSAGQIERKSKDMIYKWHQALTQQQISGLRKGFVFSGLNYYLDDADWNPSKNI